MTKPTVADKKPMSVNLDAGDHYWCACGKSSNQPFCDGSHRGTDFTPRKIHGRRIPGVLPVHV